MRLASFVASLALLNSIPFWMFASTALASAEPQLLVTPNLDNFENTSANTSESTEVYAQDTEVSEAGASVIEVLLEPWEEGLDLILETASDEPLTLDPQEFQRSGNDIVVTIEQAVLNLAGSDRFRVENPTADIRYIEVTQITPTALEVRVSGQGQLPTTEVTLRSGVLAYILNPQGDTWAEQEITVIGTRTPRPVRLTPGSISVIDGEDIDETLVRDLRDLFRYEPNVSVGNNRRYGLQDINIRGLGGNRVLILNDGVRIPTQFQFGTPSLGRDYVDIESLRRVEIVRGPASALYGSDALGGAVNFRTVEPQDLLADSDRDVALQLSTNAETVDESWVNTGIFAFQSGDVEGLVGYTRRDGFEATVPEGNDFVDDRYNSRNNFLGKLNYQFSEQHRIAFTTELFRNNEEFQVAPITAANLLAPSGFQGQDETLDVDTSRDRFSLGYHFEGASDRAVIDQADLSVYYQQATVDEERTQDFRRITPPGADQRRFRNLTNKFTDRVLGTDLQLQSNFNLGSVENRLTYGIDLSHTRNERTRDGSERRFNAAGTLLSTTNRVGSDSFPVKDFPDSDTLRLGIYLQNEIAVTDTLTLLPGLRFDHYQLQTDPDPLYFNNSPDAQSADFEDSALSPSLGIVWQATPELAVVGRYARGFRAPLYSEINAGFTNLTSPFFRYKTLSNPNLRPETSNTFELGLRGEFPRGNFSLTGFYSDYDNFIDTFANAGTTTINGNSVTLFQSQNIGSARTYGLELGGEYRFSGKPSGFSVLASLGLTVGDDLAVNQPLESVDPIKAVLGLRYRSKNDRWGTDLITTIVGEPRLRSDRPEGSYSPDAYAVVDLLGYYNITPSLTLNAGLFNLFNTQYFLYSDVQPLLNSPEPTDIDRYAQPGISLRAGLTWKF